MYLRRYREAAWCGLAAAPGCPGFGSSGGLLASVLRWHSGGLTIHSSRTRFVVSLWCMAAVAALAPGLRVAARLNSGVRAHVQMHRMRSTNCMVVGAREQPRLPLRMPSVWAGAAREVGQLACSFLCRFA